MCRQSCSVTECDLAAVLYSKIEDEVHHDVTNIYRRTVTGYRVISAVSGFLPDRILLQSAKFQASDFSLIFFLNNSFKNIFYVLMMTNTVFMYNTH